MEVVVTTGAASRAKFQSNHHHQQTNIQFLQVGCPSCRPTNSVKALKENDNYWVTKFKLLDVLLKRWHFTNQADFFMKPWISRLMCT